MELLNIIGYLVLGIFSFLFMLRLQKKKDLDLGIDEDGFVIFFIATLFVWPILLLFWTLPEYIKKKYFNEKK